MANRQVALIRGINVGRAKRVSMSDLRAAIEALGYSDVSTLLNSGNVIFSGRKEDAKRAAADIEKVLAEDLGVPAKVTVLGASEVATVFKENALGEIADNPSRLFVAVVKDPRDLKRLEPIRAQEWTPEVLAVGTRAAYIWCPAGLTESPLSIAVGRALGDGVTTRNWATMSRIYDLVVK